MTKRDIKFSYLVLTEFFLPTKDGAAVWFDEVYSRLGGRDTHIVTNKVPDGEAYDLSHNNSIHRLTLQDSLWLRPAAVPRYLKLFLKALCLASLKRFTAIHAGRVLPEGLVAVWVAKLTFHSCLIYAHGEEITTWSRSPKRLRAMKFAYRHADRVIANSEFTHQKLVELGVDQNKIELIYPGVDTSRFFPTEKPDDLMSSLNVDSSCKIILSVGRLSRRKGFDNTIKALGEIYKKENVNFCYILIGVGEDRDYLENIALESGVYEQVRFLGHVSVEDLPRWYNTCDLFVMPNREIDGDTEGFGMVFIEAGACGKPVIAGRAGGTGDAVIDGLSGFRVDGENTESIGKAILELLDNPSLRIKFGEQARRRIQFDFCWEAVAEKTNSLMMRLKATRSQ